jgi:hypothetical protein
MSYTANTLTEIIDRSFDGKKSALAKAAGLAPRVITMITGDQRPSAQNLTHLCRALATDDARELCLAASRDLIPPEYSDDLRIHSESADALAEPPATFNGLDPHSTLILKKLRALVARDHEAKEWLHLTAKWLFPDLEE